MAGQEEGDILMSSGIMTKEKEEILKHSLGINRQKKPYRNYFCAEPEDKETYPLIEELISEGYMVLNRVSSSGLHICYVTNKGKEYLGVS